MGVRGGAEFVRAAGEELFQERLRIAERVRGLLAGPVGPGFLQDLGGEEDGVAVVVPHGVVSLEHGDQQRGAGWLDGEQDADAAVGGRARPELHQALGRRLQVQLLFDLASDLIKPRRRPGGIVLRDGIFVGLLSLLDQLHGPSGPIGRLQDFLPGPEGVELHLLPLGLRGQLLLRLDRRGEPLPQPGGVRWRLRLGQLALKILPCIAVWATRRRMRFTDSSWA